ncbi:MAG: CaiB/BaiF CoA-transferase family protein [Rhodospirillaceae bacterium]|nr:CaiB/BaiF CoA-transferase family protein [Rhodospirillaceae bacterium]MDE0360346.1 CaiB/BaiF CoA-transferase family protein [Rhodospirillaceae bacterium]
MHSHRELPLAHIRVIEFSHMVMGPAAGMILADLGAEVIKIEPLGGDKTRRLKGSGAGYFPMYNRNKKSICIDLKNPLGRELAGELLAGADVLIENFRPGAMDRLGFGWSDLHTANPRLIYCSLKGFLSGPYEHRAALDEVTQMMGGLAYMTGLPDRPMRVGASVVDVTGGLFGVVGVLAALERRQRTGEGERITGSLFETTAFLVGQHMAQEAVTGEAPQPMSVRRSAWAIYDVFESREGEKIFVGVVSDTQWRRFCEEFDLQDLQADVSLAKNNERVRRRDRILPVVSTLFRSLGREELLMRLDRAGVPFAQVNAPSDLFDDPHLCANGGLVGVTLSDGPRAGTRTETPALPIDWADARFGLRQDIPAAGEHGRDVLAAAGYPPERIDELERAGLVEFPCA